MNDSIKQISQSFISDPNQFFTFQHAQDIINLASNQDIITIEEFELVATLLQLPRCTIGANKLINQYFANLYGKALNEIELGLHVLTYHHNGERIRVDPQQKIILSLESQNQNKSDWKILKPHGPLQLTFSRFYPPADSYKRAYLRIEYIPITTGFSKISANLINGSHTQKCDFEIEVIVESLKKNSL